MATDEAGQTPWNQKVFLSLTPLSGEGTDSQGLQFIFFWGLQEKPKSAVFRVGGLFEYSLYIMKQGYFTSFTSLMVLYLPVPAKCCPPSPHKTQLNPGGEAIQPFGCHIHVPS